jgi:hypothetical protein
MTIRRMAVIVIVIGIAIGALVLLDRRLSWYRYCQMRADEHHQAQARMELMADGHQPSRGFHPYLAAKYKRVSDFHAQMRRKWQDATWRPGEPVGPDPPEPE